jgi:hypothetical protein
VQVPTNALSGLGRQSLNMSGDAVPNLNQRIRVAANRDASERYSPKTPQWTAEMRKLLPVTRRPLGERSISDPLLPPVPGRFLYGRNMLPTKRTSCPTGSQPKSGVGSPLKMCSSAPRITEAGSHVRLFAYTLSPVIQIAAVANTVGLPNNSE